KRATRSDQKVTSAIVASQIQITISHDQSVIIIKNDSSEIPKIPTRTRNKDFKLRAIQQKKTNQTHPTKGQMYRTVLHVNDVSGSSYVQSQDSNYQRHDGRSTSRLLSKALNQSMPSRRSFLVSTLLSCDAEGE